MSSVIKPLELHSEKYSVTGNLASRGVQNQLGRPRLDMLTVLVREAFQNCWDAHKKSDPHVRARLDGWEASPKQVALLRDVVFKQLPRAMRLEKCFEGANDEQPLKLLTISDRNTSGLGGPTRADVILDEQGERPDFVNFLRNIGEPPGKVQGGGTFGYGKAVFYNVSAANTVCVYTRCVYQGKRLSRFFVAGLGDQYVIRKGERLGKYTGRHWWGRRSKDGVVDPLTGPEADWLAMKLGMDRDFRGEELGTTIMVIDPDFGGRESEGSMDFMCESILWNFWPKLLDDDTGQPAMHFTVTWNGEPRPLPAPARYEPLRGFVLAMKDLLAVRAGQPARHGAQVHKIRCERPRTELGLLALIRTDKKAHQRLAKNYDPKEPVRMPTHHVAWMRSPQLIVRYQEGPESQTDMLQYAGVFLAHDELNSVYAASEPPTHDEWTHENLTERHHKTFVRLIPKRIQKHMEALVTPTGAGAEGNSLTVPLAMVARSLGDLMTGMIGSGAESQQTRRRKKRKPRRTGTELIDDTSATGEGEKKDDGDERQGARVRMFEPELDIIDEAPVMKIRFDVQHAEGSLGTIIRAKVAVELDGNALETEPPEGAQRPEVLHWKPVGGAPQNPGQVECLATTANPGTWHLIVKLLDDARVRASVRVAKSVYS